MPNFLKNKKAANGQESGSAILLLCLVIGLAVGVGFYYETRRIEVSAQANRLSEASTNLNLSVMSALGVVRSLTRVKTDPSRDPSLFTPNNTAIMPNVFLDDYFAKQPKFLMTKFDDHNGKSNALTSSNNAWWKYDYTMGLIFLNPTAYIGRSSTDQAGLVAWYQNPGLTAPPGTILPNTSVRLLSVNKGENGKSSTLITSVNVEVTAFQEDVKALSFNTKSVVKVANVPVDAPPTPVPHFHLLDSTGAEDVDGTINANDDFTIELTAAGIVDHAELTVTPTFSGSSCLATQRSASNGCAGGAWNANSYDNFATTMNPNEACIWHCNYSKLGGSPSVANATSPAPSDNRTVSYKVFGADGSFVANQSKTIEIVRQPTCALAFEGTTAQTITVGQGVPFAVLLNAFGYTYNDASGPNFLLSDNASTPPKPVQVDSCTAAGDCSFSALYYQWWLVSGSGNNESDRLFGQTLAPAAWPAPMPWYRMLTLSTPGSYTLTGVVNGPGGYSACIDQVGAGFGALTVNVLPNPPPAVACNITADKNSIMTDEDTNLRYSVSGATSCSLNGTSISPNNGNDSAEKIAGGNWSDAKIFTLSCTDGTTSCTSKTVVNKLCWCAGGSFRTSDVLASKSDAANCAKEIQKWYPVLGPQCATDARYGVCSCKGVVPVSYPGYHYPELSGPKNCRCFNPGEGRFTWAGQIYKP